MWDVTLARLATAYGTDEDQMAQAVYSVAEQVHQHYCLSRGIVNHNEARPDQHVALSILGALAGQDWWMVKGENRLLRASGGYQYGQGGPPEGSIVEMSSDPTKR